MTALHLHPIKACGRIEVERVTVGPYGLVGDREWQVVSADGRFLTQRTHPVLATVRPELAPDGIVLRAPARPDLAVSRPTSVDHAAPTYTGDVQLGDGGDDAAAWFEALLGEPARLLGIAPGYERRFVLFDQETALGDVAPVLVVNEASHRFLEERAVEPFGIERWRANIVLDAGEPWIEDTWRTVTIGAASIGCVLPWPRCAVPQVDQDTGARHREPALVLKEHRWCDELPGSTSLVQAVLCGNALFGMASTAGPVGVEITRGDPVEVVERTEPLFRR